MKPSDHIPWSEVTDHLAETLKRDLHEELERREQLAWDKATRADALLDSHEAAPWEWHQDLSPDYPKLIALDQAYKALEARSVQIQIRTPPGVIVGEHGPYHRRVLTQLEVSQLVDPSISISLECDRTSIIQPVLQPTLGHMPPGFPKWIHYDRARENWVGLFPEDKERELQVSSYTHIPEGDTNAMLETLQERVLDLERALEGAITSDDVPAEVRNALSKALKTELPVEGLPGEEG